ncbi:hypothetical protein AB0I68_16755 [Streptomyces sp. NPDC050448]|uniref:hypothetical protein n=1 Tax=Streptomyces sp. NPDC050448 TaxID=3155404 RepID=UPI00341439B6
MGVPLGRPPGMYGLPANRMVGINGHPVVVVNRPAGPDDFLSGSGRAPRWFDIITSLEQRDGLSAIGHQQACVVRVAKAEKPGDLVAVLQKTAQVALLTVSIDCPKGGLVLGPDADCDAGLEDLRPLFEPVRRTEGLKPFGHGFTTPVVEIAIEPLGLCVDRIGSDPQHLRLVTRSGLSCLWWNVAEEKFDVLQSFQRRAGRTQLGMARFTATLQLDTFRGDTRVQAVINEQIITGA